MDRLEGSIESRRGSSSRGVASAAIVYKGTTSASRPRKEGVDVLSSGLERRANEMEDIIKNYLTNREKPPFSRR